MSGTTTPTSNLQSFLGADPGLTRLYDNIQAVVPAVGLSLIKLAAWNAIEDFYVRSTMRREWVNFQLAVGIQQIDFNPYDESWLAAWILEVKGFDRISIIQPATLVSLDPTTELRTGSVLLALKPVNFNITFSVDLFSKYFETILAGTLARLYEMPAKPWSAPQLATYHMQKFNGGLAGAKAIAQGGNTNGIGRWRFPYFAPGRSKN